MSKVLQFTMPGASSKRAKRRYPVKVDYDAEEKKTRLHHCARCDIDLLPGMNIVSRTSGGQGHRLRYCLGCARRLCII